VKKLLVAISILGMASLVHADMVLSVNGQVAPDEIYILPSDVIELGIMVPAGHDLLGVQAEVVLSNAQGELLVDSDVWFAPGLPPYEIMAFDSSHLEFWGGSFGATQGPFVLMGGLLFHCLESTDVIIDLHITGATTQDGQAVPVSTIEDSIIVHQWIPEPMTVALLGLGGLFLLRRRK
jgi:hypothetical protein